MHEDDGATGGATMGAGTILQIGGLAELQPQDLAAMTAERIVLVDPDAAAVAALKASADARPGVGLHALALGRAEGSGLFHTTSFARFSSLRPPAPALLVLFPGLRVTGRAEMRIETPTAFLAGLGDLPDPVRVRLFAPGSELDVLEGLRDAGLLARADSLEIRCGSEVFFEGGADRDAITAWLGAEAFRIEGCDDGDPDWPVLHLRRDPALHRARAEAETLRETLSARETELAAATEAATRQAERVAALEAAAQTAATEAKTRLATATADSAKARAEAGALRKTLTEREASLAGITEKATWRLKRIKELEAEAAGLHQTLAEREAGLAEITEKAEEQQKRIEEIEAEAETLRGTLSTRETELAAGAEAADRQASHLAALEAAVGTAEAEARALRQTLAEHETGLVEIADKAEERQKRIEEIEAEAETLRGTLSTRETELAAGAEAADRQAGRIAALEAAVGTAEAEAEALRKTLAEREAGLAEITDKAEWRLKRIKELETEAETLRGTLFTRETELAAGAEAADRQAGRIAALETAGKTAGAEAAARLATATADGAKARAEAESLRKTLAEREAGLSEITEKAEWRLKRIRELETEAEALRKTGAQLSTEMDGLRAAQQQDTALTLRMLALRDADLADLRERYARIETERNEADTLLQALTVRLTEAARHLQQIEAEEARALPAADPVAIAARPGKKTARKAAKQAKTSKKAGA